MSFRRAIFVLFNGVCAEQLIITISMINRLNCGKQKDGHSCYQSQQICFSPFWSSGRILRHYSMNAEH